MEEIKLDVQIRDQIGTRAVKTIRREDLVPAVIYGGDQEPSTIKVDRRAYERIMRHHRGQSVLFHLNVMEAEKKLKDYSAIVKEEQHDPVSDKLIHIDFKRVSLTQEIDVTVPIFCKGEPLGVKNDGGALDQIIRDLDIVCLPTNIPQKISIDVSELKIGEVLHVKDVNLPENVKTKHNEDDIVVAVVAPMKELSEESAVDDAEPEVIKDKKEKKED